MKIERDIINQPQANMDTANIAKEILAALNSPFPIRGWKVYTTETDYDNPNVFPLHGKLPKHNDEGILLEAGDIVKYLKPKHAVVYARWSFDDVVLFPGYKMQRTFHMPPDTRMKGFLTMNAENLNQRIFIDARRLMQMEIKAEALFPDQTAFQDAVAQFAKEFESSNSERSALVLYQLGRIRVNALSAFRQALQKLAQLATQQPDIWTIVEMAMLRRIDPEAVMKMSNDMITLKPIIDIARPS